MTESFRNPYDIDEATTTLFCRDWDLILQRIIDWPACAREKWVKEHRHLIYTNWSTTHAMPGDTLYKHLFKLEGRVKGLEIVSFLDMCYGITYPQEVHTDLGSPEYDWPGTRQAIEKVFDEYGVRDLLEHVRQQG